MSNAPCGLGGLNPSTARTRKACNVQASDEDNMDSMAIAEAGHFLVPHHLDHHACSLKQGHHGVVLYMSQQPAMPS